MRARARDPTKINGCICNKLPGKVICLSGLDGQFRGQNVTSKKCRGCLLLLPSFGLESCRALPSSGAAVRGAELHVPLSISRFISSNSSP